MIQVLLQFPVYQVFLVLLSIWIGKPESSTSKLEFATGMPPQLRFPTQKAREHFQPWFHNPRWQQWTCIVKPVICAHTVVCDSLHKPCTASFYLWVHTHCKFCDVLVALTCLGSIKNVFFFFLFWLLLLLLLFPTPISYLGGWNPASVSIPSSSKRGDARTNDSATKHPFSIISHFEILC